MESATEAIDTVAARLRSIAGRAPSAAAVAPGRVNLIGEHTDYTEGLVLPCAIDRYTTVAACSRGDGRIVAHALDLDASADFVCERPERRGDWLDYVQGVAFAMQERGLPVVGAELAISSSVPTGSGLSSSAALGVAVCAVLTRLAGVEATPRDWAEIAHRGESHFVGVGCGILDQFASALGQRGRALRIDCRSREVESVAFAGVAPAIVLAHSGVTRALAADGAYRARVDECAAAFESARRAHLASPFGRSLRDITEQALPALEQILEPAWFRRARHVVTENARVARFCEAMRSGDRVALGRLLGEGQASLRDDYEVSVPELDCLCEVADGLPGVVGSRLTGAGFGGCTLHLVEPDRVESAERGIADGFEARFGRRPRLMEVAIGSGAAAYTL